MHHATRDFYPSRRLLSSKFLATLDQVMLELLRHVSGPTDGPAPDLNPWNGVRLAYGNLRCSCASPTLSESEGIEGGRASCDLDWAKLRVK